MRRILVIVIGLAVAIACNVVLLLVALVSDPVTGGTILKLFDGLFDRAMALDQDGIELDGAALSGLLSLIWNATAAVCVLPLTLSVLLAEAARVRALVWHMIAPGVIAAAMPWILRLALGRPGTRDAAQAPIENRFLALFFICAALSGAIYWLIACRRALHRRR